MKRIYIFIVLMLGTLAAYAYDFEADGIYYNITSKENKTVEVTSGVIDYSGDVIIPEKVTYSDTEYTVTAIGGSTFRLCYSLTSIKLPASLKTIGNEAFYKCTSLTSIELPSSLTDFGCGAFAFCSSLQKFSISEANENYTLVDGVLYNKNVSEIVCYPGGKSSEFTVPSSVASIGDGAFEGTSLTSIELPTSLTKIGESAFQYCTSLTNIELPASLKTIGERAFSFCYYLTSIKLPASVTAIGMFAFEDCYSLTSVELPMSLTTIENGTFYICESLTSINLPASVTSIGVSAFCWCKSLTSIELPASVTSIGVGAFSSCRSLKSIELPASLKTIEERAFEDCRSLTSIELPASVTSIGGRAFKECTSVDFITCDNPTPPAIDSTAFEGDNILAVYVPSESVEAYKAADVWKDYSIQNIQTKGVKIRFEVDGIYYHVTSLENKTVEVVSGDVEYSGDVVIPKTVTNSGIEFAVTSIGKSAFYKCFTLTSVDIQADILSIPERAFSDSWRLKSVKIPSTVTSIGEYAFYECESLESIDLPESLTEIGQSAFEVCVSFKSIKLPTSVTKIGSSAFERCYYLESINIPSSLSEISFACFRDCYALKDIEIPSSVTSIDEDAFRWCESLKSINIPASVTSIGYFAFLRSGLENIIISSAETKIGGAFYNCYYLKSAEIASAVIGRNAFYGCTALTNVVLKSSVTSIGDQAFNSCYSLESVDIPAPVSYIGSGVFSGCWALKKINVAEDNMYYSSVDGVLYDKDKRTLMCYPGGLEGKFEIPNTVEKIGAWAFYQSAVSDIKIPASVSTIDLCAFYGSGLLSSVELPSSVTMIDNLAFYYCKSLETVKCNNPTPPTISSGTFDQSPIEVFYVPNEAVSAYKEADVWKYYNIQGSQKKLELMATGVENTTFSGSDTVICYTLQGMRVPGVRTMDDVKSLTPGVYICVQGNKATKVLVK